jgi:hypothetical protein
MKLTDSEMVLTLEVARLALHNHLMFNHLCDELDVADDVMQDLSEKLEKMMA